MLKKIILATALVVGSVFAQNNIHVGAHAAGSIGTAWGENTDLMEVGWSGGFNVGVDAKFVVNPQFSVLAGLGVDYRRVFWDYGAFVKKLISPYMTSEYGYSSQYDAQMQMVFSAEATYSFLYIDIPVIARINANPNFFLDAGIDLGINVVASVSAKVGNETQSDDIESEMVNKIDFNLVAGLGYSFTNQFDVYFRAVFGLTNMLDFEKSTTDGPYTSSNDYGDDDDDDYAPKFEFKNMRFHLGVSYWFM
ncbi:MAG: PorT family protein [Fibrobacter sp.]|nr:PorT family protein [Fibrobacter sp.]